MRSKTIRRQPIVLVVTCAVAMSSVALVIGRPALAATAAAPGEWTMWRRDRRATGHQPMGGAIKRPAQAWSHYLGGVEALVVVRPGKGPSLLHLSDRKETNPSYRARHRRSWALAEARYDLAGDGRLISAAPRYCVKFGKLLPAVKGCQKVEISCDRYALGEEKDTGTVTCVAYDRGPDKPRVVWRAPSLPKTHRPHVVLADIDGDGDLDVIHSDWGTLAAYDGRSGKVVTKLNWLDRRHRGLVIARDLDGDHRCEVAVIGMFHMNVSVVGNTGGKFRLLWSRDYEPKIEVQDRIVRAPRGCLADLDGDGRFELAYNLIDLTADAVWHVVVHDALSGKVLADVPGRYLDGLADLDGDGRGELILSDSTGLALPAYRGLRIAGFHRGALRERWRGHGRLHQRFDARSGPNVNDQMPFYDPVTGDVNADGRAEIFVSSRDKAGRWTCAALGFDADGRTARRLSVSGPSDILADVLAVADADGDGRRELLFRCRVSDARGKLSGRACELQLASWRMRHERRLVGPPVVADLDRSGRPTIVVPRAWDRIAALRSSKPGRPPEVLWQRPGRPMSIIYSHDHGGVLAADVDADGRKEVLFAAASGKTGSAGITCVDAGGHTRWHHALPQIQWAPARGWGPGAIRTWSVGRFRDRNKWDVYVSAHINEMHTGTSYLVDGRDGRRAWTRLCLTGRVKEMGGGHVSVADLDGDGLDEIAGGYCNFLFLLDGRNGTVRMRRQTAPLFHPVMPGSWVNSTTPLLVDADRDGRMEILLGRRQIVTALLDGRMKKIRWWRTPRARTITMPGVADVDGDGRLEVGDVGVASSGKGGAVFCLDLASGKLEWEMPLGKAEATDFASGDVDGDGLPEFVFGSGQTLYAVNGRGGKPNVSWTVRLPGRCGPPVIADTDADGLAEVLLVTEDGYLHCIDQKAPGRN